MNNADKILDDLKSGKSTYIAKRADMALIVFYISIIALIILIIWNLISGFGGFRLYILILFVVTAIVSKIIREKSIIYLSYGSSYAAKNHAKKFEKRKITIIGIGTRGALLLGNLKYRESPFNKYLNLVSANDDIRAQYVFNGFIRLVHKETGNVEAASTDLEKILTNSEWVAIIADYQELICHSAVPSIAGIIKNSGYTIQLYVYLPFAYVGKSAVEEAIERVNKLLQEYGTSLNVYFKAFMMFELKENDPFQAQEKIDDILLNDINKRLTVTMNTAPASQQNRDIGNLNDALSQ